jgi:hypothetical protein
METLPLEPITTPSLDETSTSPVTVAACPSYPINSEPSLSPPASVSRKRVRADFESPSERVAYSPDSSRATRRQRLSDSVSPSSPEQSRCPRVISESNSLLESDGYSKPCLPSDASPPDCGPVPSMFQVPIDLCPPFDLSVYDWSIMPIPLGETGPLCM